MFTQEQIITLCCGKTKKQLMRELQVEFHKRNYGKLYKKLSHKRKNIIFRRSNIISMIYLSQFKVNDIVNDYSSNHRILEIRPPVKKTTERCYGKGNGWFRNEFEQFKYEDGWMSCGCGWHPNIAKTREELEKAILGASYESIHYEKWAEIIKAGGHVMDENGILYKEFSGQHEES